MPGRVDIAKWYVYSAVAVFMLLPWSNRLCSYAIVAMTILGLFSNSLAAKRDRIAKAAGAIPFVVLFFAYIIGMIYTINVSEGLVTLEQKLGLLVIPMALGTSLALDKSDVKMVLGLFVVSNFVFTLALFVSNYLWAPLDPEIGTINFDFHTLSRFMASHPDADPVWSKYSYISLTSSRISPTYLSIYLVVSVMILLHWERSMKWQMYFTYFLIVWFSVIIAALASRTGVLLFLLVIVFEIIRIIKDRKFGLERALALLAPPAVIITVILVSPITQFRLIDEPVAASTTLPVEARGWNSLSLRMLEWRAAADGIRLNPLLGVGTGSTTQTLSHYYAQFDLGDFKKEYNAHNQYMETFLELGVGGFISLLACYITPFAFAIKKRKLVLFYISLIVIVGSLTTCILEIQKGLVFYVSFVSLLMLSDDSVQKS